LTAVREPACVGALIRDGRGRVFVQRRSMTRRLQVDGDLGAPRLESVRLRDIVARALRAAAG